MHDHLIQFLLQRQEAFPFRRDMDVRHFLADTVGSAAESLPLPAKLYLLDEVRPRGFGFPLAKSPVFDDLETRLGRWLGELTVDGEKTLRSGDALVAYQQHVARLSNNAEESSILADYYSIFWLAHSQQVARQLGHYARRIAIAGAEREKVDRVKYAVYAAWLAAVREVITPTRFATLVFDNPLLAAEEFVSPDLRELRAYIGGHLRRDFNAFRRGFDQYREMVATFLAGDGVLRRAVTQLGYPESPTPHLLALLDPRIMQLLMEHPSFRAPEEARFLELLGPRLMQFLVVQALRRGIVWLTVSEDGENVAADGTGEIFSRGVRPMDFGRRGVVEPVVFRYGLVYDITSFTQTLGEIVRGGKDEEHNSYRQMLDFQRELSEMTNRHGLQFEKFLGDGAFYTSRRATRILHAAVDIQQFYSAQRAAGFAFNKGMRIALNYGYYRLLPMRVSSEGAQIIEFYGPGIVELSRLTTGKATKELEDLQQHLIAHGYDQNDVYRFFAPLSRAVDHADANEAHREFYAYVNENGHLINEGIVASIPFLRQISEELAADGQKIYRLRTSWGSYVGFPHEDRPGYITVRLLGSVSLKGIGAQEIAEIVWLTPDEADVFVIDEPKSLLQTLQQERNRSTVVNAARAAVSPDSGSSDLVVCEAYNTKGADSVILVGEWDPVSEEVRRPIQLDGVAAERYGLAVPLTAESVETQSSAYQNLYRKLSRIETLPSFSVDAIRRNTNFSGFIIGATVERL